MIDEATKKAIAIRESVFRNTGTAARVEHAAFEYSLSNFFRVAHLVSFHISSVMCDDGVNDDGLIARMARLVFEFPYLCQSPK